MQLPSGRGRSGGPLHGTSGYLATISHFPHSSGCLAPYGRTDSFIGIAQTQTTNGGGRSQYYPGAAGGSDWAGNRDPAVVICNIFASDGGSYKATLGDVAAQVLLLQSRDLDLVRAPVRSGTRHEITGKVCVMAMRLNEHG